MKKAIPFILAALLVIVAAIFSPVDLVVGDGVIAFRVADSAHEPCVAQSEGASQNGRTQVVLNELNGVSGDVQFFYEYEYEAELEKYSFDYFDALSISRFLPGTNVSVKGHYHGLSRRNYNYVVCVYAPDGNVAGALSGYKDEFAPANNAGNWWQSVYFLAKDVIDRPGIWRMEVTLTDTTNNRRLVLARNLPVAN